MDFSSPQLYRILRTLDEIRDEEFPKEQVEAASEARSMDKNDEEFWFCEEWEGFGEKLGECGQNLPLISLLSHPEDPTPEARNAIIVLQKLTLALRSASQQNLEPSAYAGVKRKAEDEVYEREYGRMTPVRRIFSMATWAARKSSPSGGFYRNGFDRNGWLEGYKHKVYSQAKRLDNRP